MRWKLCLLHLLLVEQLTRGDSQELILTTNSPYDRENSVVFYTQDSGANLTCTLNGTDEDSSYLLAWYYNHVPRPSEGRSLVFEPINLSNGGWYTCTTSLKNRRYQLDFLVFVGGAPTIGNYSIPFSYRVQEGTRVEFPCILPGTPWPRVEWFSGDNMTPIDDAGRFRISPVSQSLVIFNTTEDDLMRNYSCRISNRFDEKMLTYNASITREQPPPSEPDIPYEADDQLVATANTNTAEINCVQSGTARGGDRFKWFRNGVQFRDGTNSALTVTTDTGVNGNKKMGSGFYCCEIYSNTSTVNNVIVFDTHCVTLVFRTLPQFVEPLPLMDGAATYHLPRGVKAGVICRGITKGSSPSPPFYDPPELTWTGPSTTGPPNNFTGLELAYSVIDIEPASSGVYQCYGHNSVSELNTTVSFDYIDRHIDDTTSGLLVDNLADDGWRANGSANITVVMNERVFLLPISTIDTIGDTWLRQDFTLTDIYSSFNISGRFACLTVQWEYCFQ
ncbi:Hemicentin-1 [Geodia barretti]|uniref:Hemicentin-1 n=1 Tax=Geodia barretti TaxID=519541 RepID=A0AA35XGL8_GEOBA|nr:Hemicentin-1 [Geodia barretti]